MTIRVHIRKDAEEGGASHPAVDDDMEFDDLADFMRYADYHRPYIQHVYTLKGADDYQPEGR